MEYGDSGEAFSIATFCRQYEISRALFYKLQSQGKAPRTFNLGRRVLISREAAREWLRSMEGAV